MEYDANCFKHEFIRRTLTLVEEYEKYKGEYDATLLVNCLLGLLILPKETWYQKIPDVAFQDLSNWGIEPDSLMSGERQYGYEHRPNLKQLVKKLRNAVAHFDVKPINGDGKVDGFSFTDRDGFCAKLSLEEIKTFVTRLANHLEEAEFEATADQLADALAADLGPNAPSLSDYAISREGIYEDLP